MAVVMIAFDKRSGDATAVGLALLITVFYMTARFFIYRALPVVDAAGEFHWALWSRRDLWMTIPRLAAFGTCLAVMRRNSPWEQRWGWGWGASWTGLAWLGASLAAFLVIFCSQQRDVTFSDQEIALGWLVTLPVPLFEEACFRGLLYCSLARLRGPRTAALASAVAFTLFHWQAQSLGAWPFIFSAGMLSAAALQAGAGLPWLMFEHLLVDGIWYSFGTNGTPRPDGTLIYLGAQALFGMLALLAWLRLPDQRGSNAVQ
jgi:membrane protease YdiL (CAAX protease family)